MSTMPRLGHISLKYPARWASIVDEIRRVDLALSVSPEEISDKCKTLAETTVKTMLIATSIKTEAECESMTMEGLKVAICEILDLDDAEEQLVKAEIVFLARSRNTSGTSGHGRSLQRQQELRSNVNHDNNEHIITLTDNLLSKLIHAFENKYPTIHESEEPFVNADATYDGYLDSQFGTLLINEVPYTASEILYSIDKIAYAEGLNEFKQDFNELYDDRG